MEKILRTMCCCPFAAAAGFLNALFSDCFPDSVVGMHTLLTAPSVLQGTCVGSGDKGNSEVMTKCQAASFSYGG